MIKEIFFLAMVLLIAVLLIYLTQKKDYTHMSKISHKKIASGVEYTKYEIDGPCVIHVVRFDPRLVKLTLEPAVGQREEVSSIASRTKACVAINGSNYRRGGRYNGNRLNIMKAHGVLYNDPQFCRGTVGWKNTSAEWHMDYISLSWKLIIGKVNYPVDRINQPRKKGEAVVYTPTADPGIVKGFNGIDLVVNNSRLIAIIPSGNSSVPSDGFVYQLDEKSPILKQINVGMTVKLLYSVQPKKNQNAQRWDADDFLLGGAGFIVNEGKISHSELYDEFSQGKSLFRSADERIADFHPWDMQEFIIEKKHPRTALGRDKQGLQYMVVVDGSSFFSKVLSLPGFSYFLRTKLGAGLARFAHRELGYNQTNNEKDSLSKGLSLPELARFMHDELGCKQALNIGGGGCSTLSINGEIINKLSQKAERPVSEALCLHVSDDS